MSLPLSYVIAHEVRTFAQYAKWDIPASVQKFTANTVTLLMAWFLDVELQERHYEALAGRLLKLGRQVDWQNSYCCQAFEHQGVLIVEQWRMDVDKDLEMKRAGKLTRENKMVA